MAFKIIVDTAANLPENIIEKYDLSIVSLSFFVNGVERKSYVKGETTDLSEFYKRMRNKEDIKTSLASPEQFNDAFDEVLKNGDDVLCICISSGISGTAQSAKIAADLAREKYPDRKIYVVDSLGASLGEGLLAYYACEMKENGKSLEEIYEWCEESKLSVCHWFTVDDLFFLKRGGRISAATAVVGTMLGIKPVLHVDNDGKLISVSKARGRKQALKALADKFNELAIDKEINTIAISHGDCEEDAQYVIDEIKKEHNIKNVIFNIIDPVIGAHSGPGTVALFFIGTER